MDHFEDQFLADTHEPLGIPFDEEAKFFHPEESRTRSSLPLSRPKNPFTRMTRYGCICVRWAPFRYSPAKVRSNLARRMERGKLRMQKSISRSALVQRLVADISERLKRAKRNSII